MEQTANFFSFSRFQGNKKLASFLFCVLLATGIWTVNALNKTQHCTIDVAINYDQSWLKSWSSGEQPSKLKIELSGRGFDLAQFLFHNRKPFIKINEEGLFNGNKNLSSHDLVKSLFANYTGQINIERISPDVITLPSKKPFFKKVAVKPSYEINLKSAFMISGPVVTVPDSVLLSSVKEFPDTFNSIYTFQFRKENVNATQFSSVKIKLPPQLNLIPQLSAVWIYIPVEEATEKVIEVPLTSTIGSKENIELVPSSIQLTCRIPLTRYDQTIAASFILTASTTSDKQKQAVVTVKNAPFWADHIIIKPATVDYFYRNP